MVALVPNPILKEMDGIENMLARYKRAQSIKELWRLQAVTQHRSELAFHNSTWTI